MLRSLYALVFVLLASPVWAQEEPVAKGDAAAFAVQQLNNAYSLAQLALTSCQNDAQKRLSELQDRLTKAEARIKELSK